MTDELTATSDTPLAAIVEKPRTEVAIESLRAEGIYDDTRRVCEDGPDRVALPITEPPTDTHVREVVHQLEPEFRKADLETLLTERGWSDADLGYAPGSWAVIGSVILVRIPDGCPDETEVATALLELHGEANSVLADEGITNAGEAGTYREPRTRLLAGERDTETIHTEYGIRYALDPQQVMFSPGNQAERVRMGDLVEPDEHVFDMFAGIGYFTLPMAAAGARVTAAELNPTAFRYLLENARLNEVDDRITASRGDCRAVVLDGDVDRVVMGYYGRAADEESVDRIDEAHEFLPTALEALAPDGVVHYHEATPESRLWERPRERLERAADEVGRGLTIREQRRVKSHSAGVSHVVLDAQFE